MMNPQTQTSSSDVISLIQYFPTLHSHQTAVITVELEYQISSVLKLTHHETGLHGPIPINPFLLLGGQGAKEALCGLAVGVC